MKIIATFFPLAALASAKESFLAKAEPVAEAETILVPEGAAITVKSMQDLIEYGFLVESEDESKITAFDQELESGSFSMELFEGSAISPDTRVIDLGSDQEAASAAEKELDFIASRRLQFGGCPSFPGSGIANNLGLTIFGFFGRWRITCRENCCARAWECDRISCKLTCQRFTIRVFTFGNVCCLLDGRETIIPQGPCFDALLCIA